MPFSSGLFVPHHSKGRTVHNQANTERACSGEDGGLAQTDFHGLDLRMGSASPGDERHQSLILSAYLKFGPEYFD